MIKTTKMLIEELSSYVSPADKLSRLVTKGAYIPIIKGLYETDASVPGYLLAGSIYGPSYLSFEFALSFYGMIPETTYNFTSATFEKKKQKKYVTPFGTFLYRDVPSKVFHYGINIMHENSYSYLIASPEKAICDQLYKTKPISNYSELQVLLHKDLRIGMADLKKLNLADIESVSELYGNTNIKKFYSYLRRL